MLQPYDKKDPYADREAKLYGSPIPSREFIMQYLDELGHSADYDHLLQVFQLTDEDSVEAMRRRLIAMVRDGQLIKNRKGSYALVKDLELICGRVIINRDGNGFVTSDNANEGLIYLAPRRLQTLFHGDRVLVQIVNREGRRGRYEGMVVEIIERFSQFFIGRFYEKDGVAFVIPDGKHANQVIIIPQDKKHEAEPGLFVRVKIISYPDKFRRATGEVVEVIGGVTTPGLEVRVAICAYNLPYEWEKPLLEELKTIVPVVQLADKTDRKNLCDLPFVTIDGADAKDYDDAVYCEPRKTGGWRLWVAIADVAYYVREGTVLDSVAYERGNSVYFPNQVVPMLPAILSNELCSLRPQVERLCVVCEMVVSRQGKVRSYQFYRAVICSKAALTYTQVAEALSDKKPVSNKSLSKAVRDNLTNLLHLQAMYRTLLKQRQKRYAIEFDTVETKIRFDRQGRIQSIYPLRRTEAHRLIEECMLLANVCAARFLQKHKMPTLYRVHEGANKEKIVNLRLFLKELGLQLSGGVKPKPKDYARLLEGIKGRADEELIQTVMLRSLKQAIYQPNCHLHFGLAYEAYTHFTSPIRRYPDLIVHRAIHHALAGKKPATFSYDLKVLTSFGHHCSSTERRAEEAVRYAVSWLKCEYVKDKLGETFDGVVTAVTGFGLFVTLCSVYVEGLVHITALVDDYYHFDGIHHRLVGKRSGIIYRLGDALRVKVVRVDLDERKIDFELQ